MSKNKKKNKNAPVKAKAEQAAVEAKENLAETVVPTQTEIEAAPKEQPEENAKVETKKAEKNGKAVEVKAKDVDKKKKKEKNKKPNKVAKALKDTGSELKKVTWPKFGEVVKQTGVVLVVVIVFALVLLGIDKLCSLLTGLLYQEKKMAIVDRNIDKVPNWYALKVYAGYENVAKQNLEVTIEKFGLQNRIFDIIIPMEDVLVEKRGKKVLVPKKTMPGYMMVKMMYGDDIWHAVTNTQYVRKLNLIFQKQEQRQKVDI